MGISERKEREKLKRRNDIIDAAEKVFFRKGFSSSTMDDVAGEAELSKGTLYLYFQSKEDLHYAICLRGLDLLALELRKACEEDLTGAENTMAIARAYLKYVNDFPNYFNAIMSFESSAMTGVDPAYHDYILKPESPLMVFARVIEKGGRDGTIRRDIPAKELAVILWSQVNGVLQFIRCKSPFLEPVGSAADDLLLHQFHVLKDGIFRNPDTNENM